jgi:hypothetical protein
MPLELPVVGLCGVIVVSFTSRRRHGVDPRQRGKRIPHLLNCWACPVWGARGDKAHGVRAQGAGGRADALGCSPPLTAARVAASCCGIARRWSCFPWRP